MLLFTQEINEVPEPVLNHMTLESQTSIAPSLLSNTALQGVQDVEPSPAPEYEAIESILYYISSESVNAYIEIPTKASITIKTHSDFVCVMLMFFLLTTFVLCTRKTQQTKTIIQTDELPVKESFDIKIDEKNVNKPL